MCLCVSVRECSLSKVTKNEGIDDDSRYRGANDKAQSRVDEEVRCKGHGDSKHRLNSDGQEQDESSAVPGNGRGQIRRGVFFE